MVGLIKRLFRFRARALSSKPYNEMRRQAAGKLWLEAAIAVPISVSAVILSLEPLVVEQRVYRVKRALEAVANEARSDARLQYDIWTASSPTSSSTHLQKFNEARADLSRKFSGKMEIMGGVQTSLVSQKVKTVGGVSTVEQPLVFLPPGASASTAQGLQQAQSRWSGLRFNNAFYDAGDDAGDDDDDDDADYPHSSQSQEGRRGRQRTGVTVDTTSN